MTTRYPGQVGTLQPDKSHYYICRRLDAIIIRVIYLTHFELYNFIGLDWKYKIWRVLKVIIRICLVLAFLYFFICSLDVMKAAFQLVGGN